jgi:hypothetical protein
VRLLDANQVANEYQRFTGLDDTASATVAVREVCRDDQPAATANFHADQAGVPTADHPARTKGEYQGIAAVVAGVEFFAAGVGDTDVVDGHLLAWQCFWAGADFEVDDLQLCRCGTLRGVDEGLFHGENTTGTAVFGGPRLAE